MDVFLNLRLPDPWLPEAVQMLHVIVFDGPFMKYSHTWLPPRFAICQNINKQARWDILNKNKIIAATDTTIRPTTTIIIIIIIIIIDSNN